MDQNGAGPHCADDDWLAVDHGPDQLFWAETFRQLRCGAGAADCSGRHSFNSAQRAAFHHPFP